ncbi:hypothetical protein [Alkalihalophilus marmarensis]|nr:hypothetical protein [Alkalihalophilus marmarensis]
MVNDNISRGYALAIGMITAFVSPAWGIGAGIVLYLLLIGKNGGAMEGTASKEDKQVS